jgi:hypothetical protein
MNGVLDPCTCGHLALYHMDRTSGFFRRVLTLWGGRCVMLGCSCRRFEAALPREQE